VAKHPNPHAPAYALRESQLESRLRVVICKPTGGSDQWRRCVILGKPIRQAWKDGRDITVVEILYEDGTQKFVPLAAMGIIAFPDGRWSRNYTLRSIW